MIVDGRKIAQIILDEVKDKLRKSGGELRLVAVLVGENPELRKFIELKKKAAEEIGIDFRTYEFPENITNNKLREELNKITKAKVNHGVIVELPLPSYLNTQYLLNTIPEGKDVDVLSEKSQGKFFTGRSKVLPPSVEAVKQIFQEYEIEPKGKTAAVFGQGLLVGKLVGHWLTGQGATVSIITEHTNEPEKISKEADIIVSGVGKPGLITDDMVKNGAVVIDFGKDVDFENVSKKVGLITSPIGGVGPIVIAAVLKNLVDLWI
ncbi:MAG: bifunctional 5,10-methylenetetrahydrofolate dehydrogenase/5,10-methenyltetrahydrofolate cyclohydrolase [Parcubacteria group bacterium]|nr:bifunctional 5,10-methylenetetrahydrofolate dehydrogenase/5,10-methenyltetrahydrofolate cyclohydrolase [Parcubacteria group bacterium]